MFIYIYLYIYIVYVCKLYIHIYIYNHMGLYGKSEKMFFLQFLQALWLRKKPGPMWDERAKHGKVYDNWRQRLRRGK